VPRKVRFEGSLCLFEYPTAGRHVKIENYKTNEEVPNFLVVERFKRVAISVFASTKSRECDEEGRTEPARDLDLVLLCQ
jgi:hypothetical protein